MLELITLLLPLLGDFASGANAAMIGKIITALVAALPSIIQEVKDVGPTIKNLIASLRGNPASTPEQLDQLDAIEKPIDDAFDAAAKAATDEDAAAANPQPPVT